MNVIHAAGAWEKDTRDVGKAHDVQLKLLIAIDDALQQGRARAEIDVIFEQLIDYSRVHFLSEELLMRLYAYPGYAEHRQKHEQLSARLEALRAKIGRGGAHGATDVVDSLSVTVLGHMDREDLAFTHYLREQVGPTAGA